MTATIVVQLFDVSALAIASPPAFSIGFPVGWRLSVHRHILSRVHINPRDFKVVVVARHSARAVAPFGPISQPVMTNQVP